MAEAEKTDCLCCLVVLCGLPGSGKSLLSQHLFTWLLEFGDFVPVVIKYDELMPPNVENFLIENQTEKKSEWKAYRRDIFKCVECLIQNIVSSIQHSAIKQTNKTLEARFDKMIQQQKKQKLVENTIDSVQKSSLVQEYLPRFIKGDNSQKQCMSEKPGDNEVNSKGDICINIIIIDDNMYYRSMRYDYYQLARRYSIGFCQVYIECPLETALERNSIRTENYIDPEIIKKMAGKIQIPDKIIQCWERHSLIISSISSPDDMRNDVLELIQTSVSNPMKPVEELDKELIAESQRICSASLLHQADLIIRQLISDKIIQAKETGMSKSDMKIFSSKLGERKLRILGQLKERKITLVDPGNCFINSSKNKSSQLFQQIRKIFDDMIS